MAPTSNAERRDPLMVGQSPNAVREIVEIEPSLPEDFNKNEMLSMASMAWPMMVSFFCRMAMASVDSAFVGHISGAHAPGTYLAAASLSDMVVNILVIPPLAFNQSLNALVSQAIGSGNKKMAGTWLQLSLFWLTVSYLPCLISFFFVGQILALLGFDAEICELAGSYAKFNVLWPIPNGWYQCMRFYFQAQGITRPAMYNNMIFLCCNVVLNWLLVFGGPFRYWCGWEGFGFVGAAMSLSLSRSLQPLAYWLYMFVYRRAHVETWPGWSWEFLGKERNRNFLNQSLPQVGTLILQATLNQTTTLMISRLGSLSIASSSAAGSMTSIFTGGLNATCNAVTAIRVGFHLGKGDWVAARRACLLVFAFSACSVVTIGIFLVPLRHQAIAVMTSDKEVQALGATLILPVLLNTFASMLVSCNTGGVFASQGRTKLSTFLSMGVELPMSLGSVFVCVIILKVGLQSVYWCQATVTWLEMAIVLVIWSRSNWAQYARDAAARQEAQHTGAPSDAQESPAASPAILSTVGSSAQREYRELPPSSPAVMRGSPLLSSPKVRHPLPDSREEV